MYLRQVSGRGHRTQELCGSATELSASTVSLRKILHVNMPTSGGAAAQ